MPEIDVETQIAAKLAVFIEGIADHKIVKYHEERLGREIVGDIKSLIRKEIADAIENGILNDA